MQKRRVPGLSLAIIQDGKIVKATGYGVTEKGGDTPVTTSTLFQAGSISKPVAALGALRLVEEGQLALDEDVNTRLVTWKVPENEFTREKKVTLRGLLSHTAGLTVHGFPGYATDEPLPTLVQVLDGAKPANTTAIRVDIAPRQPLAVLRRRVHRHAADGDRRDRQAVPAVHAGRRTGAPRHAGKHVRAAIARRKGETHGDRPSRGPEPRQGEVAHLPGDGGGRPLDDRLGPGPLRHRRSGGRWRAAPASLCPKRWRGR